MSIPPFTNPSGISQTIADGRYVKKAGDTMTGTLNIKNTFNPTYNLVSHFYKLDELTATTAIDSVGTINLANTGTAAVAGLLNNARSFNGTSDVLTNSSNAWGITTSSWAMSAWVKPASLSGDQVMMYNGDDGAGFGFYLNRSGPGSLHVLYGGIGFNDTGFTLATGTWYHLVATRDVGGTLHTYVNGVAGNTFSGAPNAAAGRCSIGAQYQNSFTIFRYYQGIVDEASYFNRYLSSTDVTSLYNSGAPLPYSTPVDFLDNKDSGGNIISNFDGLGNLTAINMTSSGIISTTGSITDAGTLSVGSSTVPTGGAIAYLNGNVGIGISAAASALHLGSDAGTSASGILLGSTGDTGLFRSGSNSLTFDASFTTFNAQYPEFHLNSTFNGADMKIVFVSQGTQVAIVTVNGSALAPNGQLTIQANGPTSFLGAGNTPHLYLTGDGGSIATAAGVGTVTPKSTLEVAGSVATAITAKSSNYTATITDSIITVTGTTTITLPTAVGITGRIYIIKKTDVVGTNVTVNTTSSQTIDGATSQTISVQYASLTVVSDGANWQII